MLDTWFSSALWPFSTLGWPQDTPDLRAFYPTSVLVTGYDILFFWVARMMMFGLYAMRDHEPAQAVPFRVVALHGLVRDAHGKKMSKSSGNVVDPLDWIDRYGADATRFTLARGANPGGDVSVSEEWVAGSRNFCNKLWNAVRFALRNGCRGSDTLPTVTALSVADRWILSRLGGVTAEVDAAMEEFEFGKACEWLYHFAWHEVCDWYLELAKIPLSYRQPVGRAPGAGSAADPAAATRAVLGYVLDRLLRLLHPVMPFITDELWTALTGGDTSSVADWPGRRAGSRAAGGTADVLVPDPAAEAAIGALMRLVTEVRRFRSDQGLRPGQNVAAALDGIEAHAARRARAAHPHAAAADHAGRRIHPDGVAGGGRRDGPARPRGHDRRGARSAGGSRRISLPPAGRKSRPAGSSQTAAFTAKAPPAVVAATRERLAAARAEIARIEAALGSLPPPDTTSA